MIPSSVWIIAPLLLLSVTLSSLFKKKKWQFMVIVLMVSLIVMELIALYFSGGFIDYQFFVNLNLNDILEGMLIFKWQAVLTIVVFLGLSYLLYKSVQLIRKKYNVLLRSCIIVISIISICYADGPILRFYEIYQVTNPPKMTLEHAYSLLKMNDVPSKENIHATSGKNIIVISLESFEKGFLNFKDLTPNLNKLTKEYTFFPNMPMSIGSSWTTASMYTYMTGMPFLIGGLTTPPLNNARETQLVSLGDILHKAGYQTRYIIGSPSFAGIGHIITLFGINIISEQSYPNTYPDAPFGLYDKDTFDIAKQQIKTLSKQKQPFAVFISTISTHAPNGFADPRMASIIPKKEDNMPFVAASLDYNLADFIQYLVTENLLANTVFYIFPDHLMMGAGTPTIATLNQEKRSLYLLTNASETDLDKNRNDTIYQIDLPRLILNGAQIKTNAKFLTDYLDTTTNNTHIFIKQNKATIAALNRSALILKEK